MNLSQKSLKDKDVNIMFGWAIFNLRLNKKQDRDNNMVEYTSEYVRCQNDIEFLGGMSIYADEAFESEEYLSKYYDPHMHSMNRGGMTLVNKNYFDFGFKLLEIVSSKLTQDDLQNNILASKIAKSEILENDDLFEEFWVISEMHNNSYLKQKEDVKQIYHELLEKVVNSRFSEECRLFRQDHTVCGGTLTHNNLVFRENLDAMSGRKRKNEMKKDKKDKKIRSKKIGNSTLLMS